MFVSLAVPAVGCPKPARDAIVSRLERSEPCMSGRAAAQTQRDAAEIGWNGGVGLGGVACTQRRAAAACRSDSDSGIPTPPSPEPLMGGVSGLASELHCMR